MVISHGGCTVGEIRIENVDDEIADIVEKFGWFAASVNDANPPFLYTIGLTTKLDHPELILFGLPDHAASAIATTMIQLIRGGKSFEKPGVYRDVLENGFAIGTRVVDPSQHQFYVGYAMGYLRRLSRSEDLRVLQVFWPDRFGKFPFESGCSYQTWASQPRLDLALTPSEIEEFERELGSID